MSYDILFLVKAVDEAWQDAMEEIESRPYQVDAEAWRRIVASAREILGKIDVDADDDEFWLIDESSGIGVHMSEYETSVTVPYAYSGTEARGSERMYHRRRSVSHRPPATTPGRTALAGRGQIDLGSPVRRGRGEVRLGR
jgi:hypothetical protein